VVGSSLSSCLLVSPPISCAPSNRQSAEVLPLEPCEFFSCLKISGGQKFTIPSGQRSGDRGIHTFTHGDTRGQRICGDLARLPDIPHLAWCKLIPTHCVQTNLVQQSLASIIHSCMCLCVLCDPQDLSTLQCDVCILVFSVTDRRSFHRTAQLRLLLRESQPQTPIILVGNKSDLVRSREISSEGSAMMFDCVYLELSASLEHGTNELLEAAVRSARGDCVGPGWTDGDPAAGRRESLTSRAKRFLAGLVPRSKIFRQKSRSCHDLSAL
uniref:RAS (RAD and GEM)-like GTP binding 2 n=1 Tax=Xiphophorus couchianus TaxID=32473 RepID=A0A3B5LHI8_9TELE